jgi:hypothetical protein
MRPVITTERNMPLTAKTPPPRVSAYHLTQESLAVIRRHAADIRAALHWKRAQRYAREAQAALKRGAA